MHAKGYIVFIALVMFVIIIANMTPSNTTWSEVNRSASWEPRSEHCMVAHDDRLWVIGGIKERVIGPDEIIPSIATAFDTPANDVWSSTNGKDWSIAADTLPKEWPRWQCEMVSFKGQLLNIGKGIWQSNNGATWQELIADAPWSMTSHLEAVVFNDEVWVVGGANADEEKNEIWRSSDGINWQQSTEPAFPGVLSHSTTVFNNRIWLAGGYVADEDDISILVDMKDLWSSADGTTWEKNTAPLPWSNHVTNELFAFDNSLWVVEAVSTNNGHQIYYQLWQSLDGKDWAKIGDDTAPWSPRTGVALTVFQNNLWASGGYSSHDYHVPKLDDVWVYR